MINKSLLALILFSAILVLFNILFINFASYFCIRDTPTSNANNFKLLTRDIAEYKVNDDLHQENTVVCPTAPVVLANEKQIPCTNQLNNFFFNKSPYTPYYVNHFDPPIELSSSGYDQQLFWKIRKLLNLDISIIYRHEIDCVDRVGCKHLIEAKASDPNTRNTNENGKFVAEIQEPLYLTNTFDSRWRPSVIMRPFTENTTVNFVVSFSSDLESIFLNQQLLYFEEMFKVDQNIRIIVSEFINESATSSIPIHMEKNSIPFLHTSLPFPFSRVHGLNAGAALIENSTEIVFFMDVDMGFNARFAETIRNRCTAGALAYFPVCFAQNAEGSGSYLHAGLGNVGMYKSDHDVARWAKKDDHKWGGEDWALLSSLQTRGVDYVRNLEPDFVHVYHIKRA